MNHFMTALAGEGREGLGSRGGVVPRGHPACQPARVRSGRGVSIWKRELQLIQKLTMIMTKRTGNRIEDIISSRVIARARALLKDTGAEHYGLALGTSYTAPHFLP